MTKISGPNPKTSANPAAAVSFRTKSIGAHIIEYDSRNKRTLHIKWSTEDDTKYDYEADLQAGRYDNGIAVRTGRLNHGPYEGWYLICIDFDKLEVFLTWCNGDCNLDSLAKWTRVDWHNNPEKIHIFFISRTPLRNMRKEIEVYGDRPRLICVHGIHKDGNRIEPYGIEKIAVIGEVELLDIKNRIKLIVPDILYDYTGNTAANAHIRELEKPETLVMKGEVHNTMMTMMTSVYFRYTGPFANMSDEDRFQWCVNWDKQKAIEANRPAYIDADPDKLKRAWEGIDARYQGQREKERDERLILDERAKILHGL